MALNGDSAVRQDQTSDLQLLVDSTPSLIHTGRPDGYLDFFNQTWLRYVGRPLEDLHGWKWTAFIHPEDVGVNQKAESSRRAVIWKCNLPGASNPPGAGNRK